MQVDSGDACRGELFGKLLGLVLGAREQDATSLTRGELADERGLLFSSGDQEHAVGHLPRGDARLIDLVAHGRGQEPASEHIDAAVERRAEQEALTVGRRRGEDPRDAREEAEVGHVVGLIEHAHLDPVEPHDLLLHEVFETAGAGHDDVDARAKRLLLRTLADAAEDGGDSKTDGMCQRLDGRGDLRGELSRGGEDQTTWATRGQRGRGCCDTRHQRQRERDRLAAAGAAAAEHVPPGERVGKRVPLDGEGLGLARGGENVGEHCGHAEVEESRHGGAFVIVRAQLHDPHEAGRAVVSGGVATARVRASFRRSRREPDRQAGMRIDDAGRDRERHPP